MTFWEFHSLAHFFVKPSAIHSMYYWIHFSRLGESGFPLPTGRQVELYSNFWILTILLFLVSSRSLYVEYTSLECSFFPRTLLKLIISILQELL